MRRLFLATIVLSTLSAACVRQERFRFVPARSACFPETASAPQANGPADQKPSLDCRHRQYSLAFIEFDSQGKAFDAEQEAVAMKLLDREKAAAPNGKIITVLYVHGWKNNAAEAPPGRKPKDVEKFQSALLELGYRSSKAAQEARDAAIERAEAARRAGDVTAETRLRAEAAAVKAVPVVGIYVGWRGRTLNGPSWFTFVSLWGRRNTANRVGSGPNLAPILNRIIDKTNDGSATSRVLMIGHSFGARVLEHAIETQKVTLYDAATAGGAVNPRVDLVLYVNSANDARLSMARLQQLRAQPVTLHHPDYDPRACGPAPAAATEVQKEALAARCRDYPLLVAITSTGDLATKYLLPVASAINSDKNSAPVPPQPPPGMTFADPTPSPGAYKGHAAAHLKFLQSHTAREIACDAKLPAAPKEQVKTTEQLIEEAAQKAVEKALGKTPTAEEKKKQAEDAAALQKSRAADERRQRDRALHPICAPDDASCRFVFRTIGSQPTCFEVHQRSDVNGHPPFNSTAFWIMDVEPTVVKDHGDIWNLSFVEMLGQLMAPRGFFDPGTSRLLVQAAPTPR